MNLLATGCIQIVYLRTLGYPALLGTDGAAVKLRKKDLALLIYLCVEGVAVHSRARLASLLWGESPEEAARHSLTQALGRLGRVLPPGTLVVQKEAVRWMGTLRCGAVGLLRGGLGPADVDDAFSLYPDHFLDGFDPGSGSEAFREWADGRRPTIRQAALGLLEGAALDAEAARDCRRVLHLGQRAVQIDRVWEQGHRLVMRALAALGERNGALRHYQEFEAWLRDDVGGEPDPDTRALAEQLRAQADPPPPPVRRDPAPRAAPSPPPAPSDPPLQQPHGDAANPARDPSPARDEGAPSPAEGRAAETEPEAADPVLPAARPASPGKRGLWTALGGVLVAMMVLALGIRVWPSAAPEPVKHGESLRERGTTRAYLAFAETLYAYPDTPTLHACTGLRTPAVREVRALPPWPRVSLPSVRQHAWMGDTLPVIFSPPGALTAYVAVGCILAGVPDPPTLDSIFGPGALERLIQVPDAGVPSMPRHVIAHGWPARPAGTLIRSPRGQMRWITYHGGALAVADSAVLATHCRSPREAVEVSEAEFRYYHPYAHLHPAVTGCR